MRIQAHVAKEKGDLTKAGWITWLINDRLQSPTQTSTFDLIFNDRVTASVSPDAAGLPASKAFGWDEEQGKIASYLDNRKAGLGQVYMKSSWSTEEETTHALFKAFPYYYFGHQHFDSLSFSIFKGKRERRGRCVS